MNNVEMKNKLLRYSVGIVYRLINYIRERFTTNIDNTKIINDNIEKLTKTRNDLTNHINLLSAAIIQQSQKINILIEKMDNNPNQIGGMQSKGVKSESSTEKYKNNDDEDINDKSDDEDINENSDDDLDEKSDEVNDNNEEEYEDDYSGALTISKSKLTTSEYLKNSSDEQNIEDLDDYIDTEGNGYASNAEQDSETSDKRLQITSETESEYSKIENLSEEII
jgi:hypothetical protein